MFTEICVNDDFFRKSKKPFVKIWGVSHGELPGSAKRLCGDRRPTDDAPREVEKAEPGRAGAPRSQGDMGSDYQDFRIFTKIR